MGNILFNAMLAAGSGSGPGPGPGPSTPTWFKEGESHYWFSFNYSNTNPDAYVELEDGTIESLDYSGSEVGYSYRFSKRTQHSGKIWGVNGYIKKQTSIDTVYNLGNLLTSYSDMFNGNTTSITTNFNFPAANLRTDITDYTNMFYHRNIGTFPDISNLTFNVSSFITFYGMFEGANFVNSVDIETLIPILIGDGNEYIQMDKMFANCTGLYGTIPDDKLWNSGLNINGGRMLRWMYRPN